MADAMEMKDVRDLFVSIFIDEIKTKCRELAAETCDGCHNPHILESYGGFGHPSQKYHMNVGCMDGDIDRLCFVFGDRAVEQVTNSGLDDLRQKFVSMVKNWNLFFDELRQSEESYIKTKIHSDFVRKYDTTYNES